MQTGFLFTETVYSLEQGNADENTRRDPKQMEKIVNKEDFLELD